jgi:hypothetical protein
MASGIKHELDLFESIMQSQVFDMPFKKDGKDFKQPYYGILSPIKLYRFIFPKDNLHQVMKMLKIHEEHYGQFDKQALVFRKILNAKKFPKIDPKTPQRFFPLDLNVAIKGIGYKEDKTINYEQGGSKLEHEGI